MKLEFPLTPKKIREGMKKVISLIREETNWDLQRTLSDVTIEIGDAPELGYNFGVNIKKNQLVFGDWLDKVEPEITSRKIWEFIIIRESLSLFVKDELLEKEISELTKLFLNFMAMAYQKRLYEGKSFESEFQLLKARFLYLTKEDKKITKQLDEELDSLLTIIVTQGITYKLIYNTYLFFIEDIPVNELDAEELVNDFHRYLSSSPEEIAAPIQFKDSVVIVINELINLGHSTSAVEIARNLRMNHSTVTKHLTKIVSRYNASWRREPNWMGLGLHTYLILIEFSKDKNSEREDLASNLLDIPFVFELFDGENSDSIFLYSVLYCPHSIINNLTFKLDKMINEKTIKYFEIKPIKNRLFKTSFVHPQIKPALSNYEKLINGKIPIQKFNLWNTIEIFNITSKDQLDFDIRLLKFLSILISKAITTKGFYGVWLSELSEFLTENNIDPKDTLEATNFFNKMQNIAVEKNLLDFRLSISPSILNSHEQLVVKIICDPESDFAYRLIDDLSVFGWVVILHSYDELYMSINGLNYQDVLSELITGILKEKKIEFSIFSIKSRILRHVPYNELYDFDNKKWKF
jgi:DNA-binding MarR family transcriptional regulator